MLLSQKEAALPASCMATVVGNCHVDLLALPPVCIPQQLCISLYFISSQLIHETVLFLYIFQWRSRQMASSNCPSWENPLLDLSSEVTETPFRVHRKTPSPSEHTTTQATSKIDSGTKHLHHPSSHPELPSPQARNPHPQTGTPANPPSQRQPSSESSSSQQSAFSRSTTSAANDEPVASADCKSRIQAETHSVSPR